MSRADFKMHRCVDCARAFLKTESNQRQCRLCIAAHGDDLDLELAEVAWEKGYRLGYERGRNGLPSADALTPELIKQAIALCHPDRHPGERSQEANDVTARLIVLRELLEEARAA